MSKRVIKFVLLSIRYFSLERHEKSVPRLLQLLKKTVKHQRHTFSLVTSSLSCRVGVFDSEFYEITKGEKIAHLTTAET